MESPAISYIYDSVSHTVVAHAPWDDALWRQAGDSVVPDTAWLLHPAASPAEVWGAGSSIAGEMQSFGPLHRMEAVGDPWQTSVVMVVLICFYCYLLYRYRRDLMSCLKNIGSTENTLTLMEEQGADFAYFLRSGIVLAILGASSLIMAWLELHLPRIASYYLFLGAVAASLCVVLYRRVAFGVMQWLTDDKSIFQEVTFINRIDITFMAVFYTPIAVIVGVSGRLFDLGMIALLALVGYHFLALYKYFRLRLFSKLQWILYLCAVEILPVSFIIALAIRKSGIN